VRIAYFDLSHGFEHLVKNPNRYGGGRIVPTYCRELMDDFYCFADAKAFEEISVEEKRDKCIAITDHQSHLIKSGEPIETIIPQISSFDLIFHNATSIFINTQIPQAVWTVGFMEKINPNIKNLLCHNFDYQHPIFDKQNTKIFHVKLGVPVPPFEYYNKKDFLFLCANQSQHLQTIILAQFCNNFKIRCIFGGPIAEGYELLKHIDNKNTFYIGVLPQQEKIKILKESKIHPLFFAFPINNPPLSCLEAMSYGNSIMTTAAGVMPSFIKDTFGRILNNSEEFYNLYQECLKLDQFESWRIASIYNEINMVESFKKSFKEILT